MDWFTGSKQGEAKKIINQLEDASKRDAAARALIALGADAVAPLITALQNPNPNLIRLYQQILARIPASIPALSTAINSASKQTRVHCVETLGLIKNKSVLQPLTDALNSEFYLVRTAAATALGNTGAPEIIPALFKAMKDPEEEVRAAACTAVSRFNEPSTFDELTNVILDDSSIEVRRAAVVALGNTRNPAAIPFLLEALHDSFWWYERGQAVQDLLDAIEKMGHAVVEPLIQSLADKEMTVRKFAAILLGRLGNPSAIEELGMALYDMHHEVSVAAAEALTRFGPQAIEIFTGALNHPEASIRQNALQALGQIPDARVFPFLIHMLNDPDKQVVIRSIQAIASLRVREARPALEQIALNRSNRELAALAKQTLEHI
jgi:HEAT repeat protein